MREIIKLILNGESSGLDNTLTRSGRNITNFGNRATAVFSRMGRTIQSVSDRIPGLASVASGAALVMAGKGVIDFDANLARMSIQAGLTRKEMFALKAELLDTARKTYQLPTDLLAGMEQIVEKTGNFQLARDTIVDMGTAASATGAEMASIGAVTSNLNQKFQIGKKEIKAAFDILNEQGKAGAFTLKEMAQLGERLFTAGASFGVKGLSGLRQFGAFIQIARTGTGSSEMATTAVERTIADLLQKAAKVKKVTGFSIFDEAASKREGRSVMKSIDVVLKEIITRTKGDTVKLRQMFGEESIRAIDAMALSYRRFGDFREFDALAKQGGDGAQMMKDFSFWTEQSAAKISRFRGEISKFANENLAGPIDLFTRALDLLNRHPIIAKGGLYTLLGLAGIAGGAKAIGGIIDLVSNIGSIWSGKKKGNVPESLAGPLGRGMTGPVPVYVVNKRLSLIDPTGGAGKIPGANIPSSNIPGSTTGSKAGKVMSAIGKVGAVAGAGAAGYELGGLINSGLGWLSGKATGGKYSSEGWLGNMLYDFLHKAEKTEVKNDIKLNINIDKNGRVVTESNNPGTNLNINLARGSFGY